MTGIPEPLLDRYYRIDFRPLTYGECWRCADGLSGFLGLVHAKWGAIPTPAWATVCFPASWPAIDPAKIPGSVARRMAGPLADLIDLGFRTIAHLRLPLLESFRWQFGVLLLSSDGQSGAVVADQRMADGGPIETFSALGSQLDDGTFISTRNEPRRIDPGPGITWYHHPRARANVLVARHQELLDRLTADGRIITRCTDANVMEFALAHDRLIMDNLIDRGFLVEMTDEEIAENLRLFGEDRVSFGEK